MTVDLRIQTPLMSTPILHHGGDPTKKAYQAHLSFDEDARIWVGYITHGPAIDPGRNHRPIDENVDPFRVLRMVNDRLEKKHNRGRANGYSQPGHLYATPQLDRSRLRELANPNDFHRPYIELTR